MGIAAAPALASRGNSFVFGPGEPPEEGVEAYRLEAEQARKEMRGQVSRLRRLRSDVDVRPLLTGRRRLRLPSRTPTPDVAR